MANSTRISGKDVVVSFNGTNIEGDVTSVSVSDEGELVDVTAGDETFHYFISLARRNATIDFEAFYEGTTTIWDAVAPNLAGTLIIQPRGTAAALPKWTWDRALVSSRSIELPFDGASTISLAFQTSALVTEATN